MSRSPVRAEVRKAAPLFILGLAVNLGFLGLYYATGPKALIGDEAYYMDRAQALVSGGAPEPNPLWPPFYSDLMAVVFSVTGPHILAIQIIQILMNLAAGGFLWRIAAFILKSEKAAAAVLGAYLLSPEITAFSHFLWPETVHLCFSLAAIWLLMAHGHRPMALAAAGFSLSLALLSKLLLLPFIPVVFAVYLFNSGSNWRPRLARTGFAAAVMALTLLPTLVRNLMLYERPMVADSSVFNLWVGLNDRELADYRNDTTGIEELHFNQSGPDLETRNKVYRQKIAKKIESQGWPSILVRQLSKQYFRLFHYEQFFATQLPGEPRQAYTFGRSFLTRCLHWWDHGWYVLLLAAAALGIAGLHWKRLGWEHLFALFLVYNLGLFLLVHVKTRYMIQMMPALLIFCGMFLRNLEIMYKKRLGRAVDPPVFPLTGIRWALGTALALLWLYLALGP